VPGVDRPVPVTVVAVVDDCVVVDCVVLLLVVALANRRDGVDNRHVLDDAEEDNMDYYRDSVIHDIVEEGGHNTVGPLLMVLLIAELTWVQPVAMQKEDGYSDYYCCYCCLLLPPLRIPQHGDDDVLLLPQDLVRY